MNIKHRVCAECGIARASRGATDRGDPHEARALDGTIASSAFCLFDLLAGVRINAEVPARARAIHEEHERPWPPIPSTFIYGLRDAVLVDSFITLEQAEAQADWIACTGKNVITRSFATTCSPAGLALIPGQRLITSCGDVVDINLAY